MTTNSAFNMSITRSDSTDNLANLMAEEGSEGAAKAALNGLVSFVEGDSCHHTPWQMLPVYPYAVFRDVADFTMFFHIFLFFPPRI
jgi:hypothetical protein